MPIDQSQNWLQEQIAGNTYTFDGIKTMFPLILFKKGNRTSPRTSTSSSALSDGFVSTKKSPTKSHLLKNNHKNSVIPTNPNFRKCTFFAPAEDCRLLPLEPLVPCPASAGAAAVEAGSQRCGAAQQRREGVGGALATSAEAVGGDWAVAMKTTELRWLGHKKE